ncbi:hypothetical protein V8F20_002686 [Naviculisporaceae sp. PSN 640]
MKGIKLFLTTLALPWLATASPFPQEPPDAPMGGDLVTDPEILAGLEALHALTIKQLNEGVAEAVETTELKERLASDHHLEERIYHLIGIAGYMVIKVVAESLVSVIGSLINLLTKIDDQIWENPEYCRVEFSTHAGWDGKFKYWNRGRASSSSPDEQFSKNIAWNNPTTTDPPVWYFYNDKLGYYSYQFTGTDTAAWPGIPGTTTCSGFQGICNPQIVFYHAGYNIVLNTWQSQGRISACQYSGGEDCKGTCFSGVRGNELGPGGVVWGGKCAVPCRGDGGENPEPAEAPKVMVVGDSISHGMEDDFTWRWRLFYWMRDVMGRRPFFVGPWAGTHGPTYGSSAIPNPPLFPGETEPYDHSGTTGRYNQGVPESFAYTGHASKWGRQIAQTKDTIGAWVSEYQPDFLFILLGFNDLGWWVSGPEDAVGNMGVLINNARNAKPNIRILVGNVVHRTFIGGRQDLVDNTNRYNQLLKQNIESWWFRWESPIVYVDVNSRYQCTPHNGCPDAYDGLHPNAMGEFHIAEAFSIALRDSFGYIGPPLSMTFNVQPRSIHTPNGLSSSSWPEGIRTQWDMVRNARGYDIRARIQGAQGWWSEGPVSPNSYVSWDTWVLNGQTWEFQVRTRGDGNDVSDWSGSSFATANVQTSPGPSNIIATPIGSDGIQITWYPVTGYSVNRYAVIIWDRDEPGAFIESRPTTSTAMTITGLRNGHRYGTWVSTYVNINGKPAGGIPASGREVFVGRGAPASPGNLRVTNLDPTTVMVEWSASASASGYQVNVYTMNWTPHGEAIVSGTSHGIGFLFPGTWNYRFCVSAFNGNLQSSTTSNCVIPPVYPGWKKRDVVPNPGGGNFTAPFGNITMGNGGNSSTGVFNTEKMLADEGLQSLFKQMMIQEAVVEKNVTLAGEPEELVISEEVVASL